MTSTIRKYRSIHDITNIMRTDSYKTAHHLQTPPKLEYLYSYMESRGGLYSETVMFGLTYYLKEYLSRQITMADVDYAEERVNKHMGAGIFNRAGWERIVNVHNGYFPIVIHAAPEGLVVPTRNVLLTIENTDPLMAWCTNYVETMLLKMWYSITVATISRSIKKAIASYLDETGDPAGLSFKLHDFGYRGVSSEESAAIGGMAHLINFMGTDTMIGYEAAEIYYGEDMAGFSIPASEHSTMTAWGMDFEYEAYQNMIKQFGKGALYAVVSDSYDIYNACDNIWGQQLKAQVEAASGTLVIRPDSGVPHEVVRQIVEILGNRFGFTTNDKGYKVLNHVRVIQGDGINHEEIVRILEALKIRGWSADNVAFGMGGALLQQCNRDTQKFAIKASSIIVNGKVKDVYKAPVTDNGKRSKRGRLKLVYNDGVLETIDAHEPGKSVLQKVWENGHLLVDPTFAEIRERASL
jgi:nicotinamide phosphoribosyltransferase